jgi:hypothetical protein
MTEAELHSEIQKSEVEYWKAKKQLEVAASNGNDNYAVCAFVIFRSVD